MAELRSHGLALSAVSLGELWEGVHYSRNPQESENGLHDFLKRVSLIGVDEDDLPAAQAFSGNSNLLVAPAWRLRNDVHDMSAARAWMT